MNTTSLSTLVLVAAFAAGCAHDSEYAMRQDAHHNDATTSDFNAMDRAEYTAAMRAGMVDFDAKLLDMKAQAQRLGEDALEELAGDIEDLERDRAVLEAELGRLEAMLDEEWRDHREDVTEQYFELREDLDDTYDEVVEEG